jgi:nicotinate-nucleotide--dimethylbenzimidazole phosphoribosyltransferase
MYFFEDIPLDKCVGAGAGLNSEGIQHKYAILAESIENFQRLTGIESITPLKAPEDWQFVPGRVERQFFPAYAEEIIRWFGGFEMVAAIGGMLQAAEKRMVILVDGFIMTACMLAASQLYPAVLDYAIFAHQGDESGHRMMLQAMDADPILHLDLRLGEGTGALCAFPIVRSAVNMINEMNNFQNANITKYF